MKTKNLEVIDVSLFTKEQAKEFLNYLIAEKKINATTRNNYLAVLKIFYNDIVNDEIIDKNPFDRIEKIPE